MSIKDGKGGETLQHETMSQWNTLSSSSHSQWRSSAEGQTTRVGPRGKTGAVVEEKDWAHGNGNALVASFFFRLIFHPLLPKALQLA